MKKCMRLFKIVFPIIIVVGFNSSCISTKNVMKIDEIKHGQFITSEIKGKYKNTSIDGTGNLWKELVYLDQKLIKPYSDFHGSYSDSATILIAFNDKFLIASIYENDSLREMIQYRARVRDNYIAIRRNFLLFPTPIIFLYSERKTCLTLDINDNSLILKTGRDECAFVLIIGNGQSDRYLKKFESVKIE